MSSASLLILLYHALREAIFEAFSALKQLQKWSAASIEIEKHRDFWTYVTQVVHSLWGPVHAGTSGTIDIISLYYHIGSL